MHSAQRLPAAIPCDDDAFADRADLPAWGQHQRWRAGLPSVLCRTSRDAIETLRWPLVKAQ